MLTSNPAGTVYCNGSEVIFTCETRGSPTLTWRGDDDYVGNGAQLGFAAEVNPIGTTMNSSSNPNTVATLTQNSTDDGVSVLVSTLRIIATSDAPSGNIMCAGTNNKDITFRVLGELYYCDYHKVPTSVYFLALPVVPQDVVTFHFNAFIFCFAISILRSPTNPAEAGATNYSLSVDGSSVSYGLISNNFNLSDGMMYFILVHQSNCSARRISITANNMCGQSPSTNEIVQSIVLNFTSFGGASNIECKSHNNYYLGVII